jgi:hypothetical protein
MKRDSEKAFEGVLKRMLSTPPNPHKKSKAKKEKTSKKKSTT